MSDVEASTDTDARATAPGRIGGNPLRPEPVRVPEWVWTRGAQYEQAVTVGPLVLTCGVAPFDEAGAIVGRGDFEAQLRRVVENLRRLLEAAGSGMDLIARQHVFLRRSEDLPEFRQLREELYSPPYPASVVVVVTALAHPDMLVEITVEAIRRPTPSRELSSESSRPRPSTRPKRAPNPAGPRPEAKPKARE